MKKLFYLIWVIAYLMALPSVYSGIQPTRVVSCYDMDTEIGGVTPDFQGANDGAVGGAVLTTGSPVSGSYYDFDGINDAITIGTYLFNSSTTKNNGTICAWVRFDGAGASQSIVGHMSELGTGEAGIMGKFTNNALQFLWSNTAGNDWALDLEPGTDTDLNWNLWCMVWNASSGVMYKNTTILAIDTDISNIFFKDGRKWTLGNSSRFGSLNGGMDVAVFWNTSLRENEIEDLYDLYGNKFGRSCSYILHDTAPPNHQLSILQRIIRFLSRLYSFLT